MISPRYININRILAVATFLISFIVYFDTMAPSVSYWDCGEFIAVSYTLGVPHPPGSPLFLLLGRIASMMPISEDIAFRVNLLSPLVSAFAVLFLYFIIVQLVSHWRGKINSNTDALVAFGAGIVGSLTFAFTDSHWFNAVEAEVYAFSTFFTAIVVWLALLWSEKADEQGNERYILIISYMIGLATGLHLLNLLTIPFVALLIYFRKFKFEWTSFGVLIVLTGLVFFIIHNVIIKGMPKIADAIGVSLTGLLIISIFAGMVWAVLNHKKLTSIILIIIFASCSSNKSEWLVLFDGESVSGLRGYRMDAFPWGSWAIEDGSLKTVPGEKGIDIISTETFKDFELELDWKLQSGGNSGIFYFATEDGDFIWQSAPEMQVLDNISHRDGLRDETSAGALYDLIPTIREAVKPLGEFNKVRILSKDGHIEHWLNDTLLLEYDHGSPAMNELIAKSKFRDMPFFAKASEGRVGLQGDHGEVWYRNIRIKKL